MTLSTFIRRNYESLLGANILAATDLVREKGVKCTPLQVVDEFNRETQRRQAPQRKGEDRRE